MTISLRKLIMQHYNELDYIGTVTDKTGKEYIRVGNKDIAEKMVTQYNNLKLVFAYREYAPEIKSVYITLK